MTGADAIAILRRMARAIDNRSRLAYATHWRRCTEWYRADEDGPGAPPCFETPTDDVQRPLDDCCAACQERYRLWPEWEAAQREARNARRQALRAGRAQG